MRFVIRSFEDIAFLDGHGDFVTTDIAKLSGHLDRLIEAGKKNVAFDMDGLSLINSAALAYVIRTKKLLDAEGGDLVIVRPSQFVRRTLLTLGLDELLGIYDDPGDALVHLHPDADRESFDLDSLPVVTDHDPDGREA